MFDDLQAYYDHLENDSTVSLNLDISKGLLSLRDTIEDAGLKTQCSHELFFTDFYIEDGEVKPYMVTNRGEYPHMNLFEDDFKYIISRAENVVNPKYKSKYNHLLWCSKKHNTYAKEAIESYFTFLQNLSFPTEDNLSNQVFENYFKNLFSLSQSVNYKKEKVLDFLNKTLGSGKLNGFHECSLMNYVAESGKKVDASVLNSFYTYSDSVITNAVYPGCTEEYLKLLILLCAKLRVQPKDYHNKLAEFYIQQSTEDEQSFVTHDFYLKALLEYRAAGNKEKIEEVTVLIEKTKKHINFKTIKVEHTDERLQQWWDTLRTFTDNMIEKHESKDIYDYLMLTDKIFPKAEVLGKTVKSTMMDLVSVMTFDINKNVSGKGKDKGGINTYFIHIQNLSIRHLWLVFRKGIKSGKISYETLMEFLKNYTWYGEDHTYQDEEGETEGFDWIELLSPALYSFFVQSEIDIKSNKNNNQGYVLAIDSLVLKFEGLFREFSRNIGAQTIDIKENGTQERISFEKLLENPKFIAAFPPDDIALFKFLFTDEGMNLRNSIAHCFYKTKSYSAGTMLLLITALLKLGNYRFIYTEESPN